MMRKVSLTISFLLLFAVSGFAQNSQQARWAGDNDPIAKRMIEFERKWAESGCDHNNAAQEFVADDFQGTAPNGSRYAKTQLLEHDSELKEKDCHLDSAKVRFFGDSVALVYGSERALHTDKQGSEKMVCLVWTDTWLKRSGKWQIVAAQDTAVPCK